MDEWTRSSKHWCIVMRVQNSSLSGLGRYEGIIAYFYVTTNCSTRFPAGVDTVGRHRWSGHILLHHKTVCLSVTLSIFFMPRKNKEHNQYSESLKSTMFTSIVCWKLEHSSGSLCYLIVLWFKCECCCKLYAVSFKSGIQIF